MNVKYDAGFPAVAALAELLVARFTQYVIPAPGLFLQYLPAQLANQIAVYLPDVLPASLLTVFLMGIVGHNRDGTTGALLYGIVGAVGFAVAFVLGRVVLPMILGPLGL